MKAIIFKPDISWRGMVSFSFRPYCPKERGPGNHRVRSKVGLKDGLEAFQTRKTSYLGGNQSQDFPFSSP